MKKTALLEYIEKNFRLDKNVLYRKSWGVYKKVFSHTNTKKIRIGSSTIAAKKIRDYLKTRIETSTSGLSGYSANTGRSTAVGYVVIKQDQGFMSYIIYKGKYVLQKPCVTTEQGVEDCVSVLEEYKTLTN